MFPLCVVSFSGARYNALFIRYPFSTCNDVGKLCLCRDLGCCLGTPAAGWDSPQCVPLGRISNLSMPGLYGLENDSPHSTYPRASGKENTLIFT